MARPKARVDTKCILVSRKNDKQFIFNSYQQNLVGRVTENLRCLGFELPQVCFLIKLETFWTKRKFSSWHKAILIRKGLWWTSFDQLYRQTITTPVWHMGWGLAFQSPVHTQRLKCWFVYLTSTFHGKIRVTLLKSIELPWIYSALNEIRVWLKAYSINESDAGNAANTHPVMALTQPWIFKVVLLRNGMWSRILGLSFILWVKFTSIRRAGSRPVENSRAI